MSKRVSRARTSRPTAGEGDAQAHVFGAGCAFLGFPGAREKVGVMGGGF